MMGVMSLDTIEIETGEQPSIAIIVLHGLGADGNDFVPFAEEIDLRDKGDVRWIFPHAPTMPVTINGGYVMRAWYDILGLELVRREDEGGLRRSLATVHALVDRERSRGVTADRVVLAGFSQGCAMALLAGLRYPQRLAGIVGMSGYLPLAHTLAAERSAANADVPIFMAHGRADPVVPFDRALASRDALKALGYPLEWHEYAMPHSVCPQEVHDLRQWLLKVL